jgi:hypothetical protein
VQWVWPVRSISTAIGSLTYGLAVTPRFQSNLSAHTADFRSPDTLLQPFQSPETCPQFGGVAVASHVHSVVALREIPETLNPALKLGAATAASEKEGIWYWSPRSLRTNYKQPKKAYRVSGRARLGRIGLAITVPEESNRMRGASPKAVELRQVQRKLNDLHELEHELRTALCSCKKELHKRSARCPLLRDPTPSR